MTPEQEKFYNKAQDMFRTEGWKNFQDDIKNIFEVSVNLDNLSTTEDLWKAKGRVDILRYVANYNAMVDAMAIEDNDESPE